MSSTSASSSSQSSSSSTTTTGITPASSSSTSVLTSTPVATSANPSCPIPLPSPLSPSPPPSNSIPPSPSSEPDGISISFPSSSSTSQSQPTFSFKPPRSNTSPFSTITTTPAFSLFSTSSSQQTSSSPFSFGFNTTSPSSSSFPSTSFFGATSPSPSSSLPPPTLPKISTTDSPSPAPVPAPSVSLNSTSASPASASLGTNSSLSKTTTTSTTVTTATLSKSARRKLKKRNKQASGVSGPTPSTMSSSSISKTTSTSKSTGIKSSSAPSAPGLPPRGTPYFKPTPYSFVRLPIPYTVPPKPLMLDRIHSAVSKAHRDLLSTGKNVTAWQVSQIALHSLQAHSWKWLGFELNEVPPLKQLMDIEGKVDAFIHCFAEVRKITSLYDLEVEVCRNEGVKKFDEFHLGPLLQHPLVLRYFLVPSDAKEIHKITSQEIISYLVEFIDCSKQKAINTEGFLNFLAMKQSVPAKEQLCIQIQNLGMHVTCIRKAKKAKNSALNNCLQSLTQSSNMQTVKVDCKVSEPHPLFPQKKVFEQVNASSQHIKFISPIQRFSSSHSQYVSSGSEDENDDNGINNEGEKKDDNALCHQCNIVSQDRPDCVNSCLHPLATEEMVKPGLQIEMDGHSFPSCIWFMCDETKSSTATKRKCEHESVDASYPSKLRK